MTANVRTIAIGDEKIQIYCYDSAISLDSLTLPDLSDWPHLAEPTQQVGLIDAYSCQRYDLGNRVNLFIKRADGILGGEVSCLTMEQHLLGWDWASMGFDAASEFLAAWGLDGLSQETVADQDHPGECVVWREPNYYAGVYGAPVAGLDRDEHGNVLIFACYADAAKYVNAYYGEPSDYDGIPQCNVLSHGQAGADSLTIVIAP